MSIIKKIASHKAFPFRFLRLGIISIFLLGLALRILFFTINDENLSPEGDAESWSRINITQHWFECGSGPDLNFGTLDQFWIYLFYLLDKNHVVLYSRLVSLLTGIALLFIFFLLVNEIYNFTVACYGTFLLSIFPLHIYMCSVSLAGGPAIFFLISALYYLVRFINYKKLYEFFLSIFLLNLSLMLRFECWAFIFIFAGILLWQYRWSWIPFVYCLLGCMYPLLYMYFSWSINKDPLIGFVTAQTVAQASMVYVPLVRKIMDMWQSQLMALSLPVFLLCIGGIVVACRRGRLSKKVIFIFFCYLFAIIVKVIQGAYDMQDLRYSLIPGILLLPFGGVAIEALVKSLRGIKKLMAIVIIVMVCFHFSLKTTTVFASRCHTPPEVHALIQWLRGMVGDKTIYFQDRSFHYHPYILLRSKLSHKNIVKIFDNDVFDDNFLNDIKKGAYVLMHGDKFKDVQNQFPNYNIVKVFESGKYRIFQKKS